jgi:hypothetical protein
MAGDSRNSKRRRTLKWDRISQQHRLIHWNGSELGRSSKRAVGLRPVTPHPTPYPFWGDSFPYFIHYSSTITVRNDARVRHPDPKRILTLFNFTGVHA